MALFKFFLHALDFALGSHPWDFLMWILPDRFDTNHLFWWLHHCLPQLFLFHVPLSHELLPIEAVCHPCRHMHLVLCIVDSVVEGTGRLLPPSSRCVIQEPVCVGLNNQRVLVSAWVLLLIRDSLCSSHDGLPRWNFVLLMRVVCAKYWVFLKLF